MKTKTIMTIGTCVMLLLSTSGDAQDEANGNRDERLITKTNAQDSEGQRERRDLFALQRASRLITQNQQPDNDPRFDGKSSKFGTAQRVDRVGINLDQFPAFVPNSRYSTKLAKINEETASGIYSLVQKIKESDSDDEKEELKNEIHGLLDAQYDAYLDHHEEPLKQLEARLTKLREEFEARKKAKTDLVKLRLDTVWYDAIGLGWPGSGNGPATFFAPGYRSSGLNTPTWPSPARFAPRANTPQLTLPPLKPGQGPAAIPSPPTPNGVPGDRNDRFDEPKAPSKPGPPLRSGTR